MNTGRLNGKAALVTGASRGIGRGIAERLARDGAVVAIHYGSRRDAAEEAAARIQAEGGTAFPVGADLGSLESIEAMWGQLDAKLTELTGEARFDILVNNAGIGTRGKIGETTEAMFDELMTVNVKAPFFLIQGALPRMRDGGRIINISSGVTRIAYPDLAAYNMTKGALNTLTLTLAKELGPRGITVNAILPGIVDTEMNAAWLHEPQAWKFASEMSALGRVGQPGDIADIAGFLASDDSRWVTAQMIDATGGSHL
ncbi:SDR family oxidoreductase [Paenibacillus mucilaginosus]|uniref:Short-chain dehydrogenase/reductase SDR n=2 Tax=Paenibacillus mucilaginosus TaxID=61624 RepID=H6N9R9_9BACL|nr:SDR family oxidoreductase [Paenibacillus mucilaginosus]AEI41965.1 short-chain dehydrogenase/reductase SDR [Paenibacillus mucilaginosus KNP414]AFC28226.1 short-chain dehydrogenase/reductase SDR [Paenibacillus mucilaginosus 3016]MCG7217849.1 SDR family oxidoreductase [Paenibacillus mucilaginosus]WDM28871.1 SDR family oxidoreductase [Paenibacillus mucilaginosus]WFA17047.1 SDR family oxidoreductase [Paenibacillus mucilaginosus]